MHKRDMNTESNSPAPSRRQLLKGAVAGALAGLASVPGATRAAPASITQAACSTPQEPHAMEHDYPFFGGELPEAYRADG